MTAFFVGLDLAQPQESTALAVLAREVVARQTSYAVRHLERWPPGTPYPHMASEVSALLGSRELRGCRMVVDQTAVGRSVASMFRSACAGSVLPVLISAGHAVTRGEDGCTDVPKKELVSAVQALLQTRRIKVASGMPLAETLSREMASFRAAVKLSGGEDALSWREREHDDLVLAVALAAWEGERNPPCFGKPLILYDRVGRCWDGGSDHAVQGGRHERRSIESAVLRGSGPGASSGLHSPGGAGMSEGFHRGRVARKVVSSTAAKPVQPSTTSLRM